jgi:tubby-related protein 1
MCSKKLGGKRGSYFTITGTSETNLGNKKHPLYLGKLRSNFIGSQYRLFSPGWNPSKAAHANMYQLFRRELLVVLYSNMLWKSVGTKGPRKMTVAVPSVIHPTDYYTDHEALLRAAKTVARDASVSTDCHPTGVEILENKEPRWNASINGYVLNFSERVKEPSVKNFQLVKSERIKRVEENPSGPNIDQVILQFGRLNDTEYSLDFASPITPLMAFALALSSLDFKLCCE